MSNVFWFIDMVTKHFENIFNEFLYRVSNFIRKSKFGIEIIFDGRGYGVKIFRIVRYLNWFQYIFI